MGRRLNSNLGLGWWGPQKRLPLHAAHVSRVDWVTRCRCECRVDPIQSDLVVDPFISQALCHPPRACVCLPGPNGRWKHQARTRLDPTPEDELTQLGAGLLLLLAAVKVERGLMLRCEVHADH